ncbi:PorP/SprF family type IX secretion system membrane protein, partial [Confluentibacter sediminis]|uniref:PorP/SprF family type IX secretion system membrane protein n=1 Tax=Confluentibacter sediminis TaxID=2219045 RepID=UPI0013A6E0C8
FGIKGGFNSYNANTDGLVTYGVAQDPKLMNLSGRLNPNFGAGIYLRHEDYFISLSVPKILNSDRLEEENGIATVGSNRTHVYLSGGYDVALGGSTVFKPSVLFRYVNASPLSVDLTGVFEFNHNFDLGAAYRIDESVSGMVFFNASKSMRIGYAYESSLKSSIQHMDNGTHEIMLHLKL